MTVLDIPELLVSFNFSYAAIWDVYGIKVSSNIWIKTIKKINLQLWFNFIWNQVFVLYQSNLLFAILFIKTFGCL